MKAYLFRNAENKATGAVSILLLALLSIPLCRNGVDGLKQVQLCSRDGQPGPVKVTRRANMCVSVPDNPTERLG